MNLSLPGSSWGPVWSSPCTQATVGTPSQAPNVGSLALSLPLLHPLWASLCGLRQGLGWKQKVTVPRPHCAQGQVTRAQEAEENYVIKRELAVVRQQCSSAAEDLQKAQCTIRQLQEQQVAAGVEVWWRPDRPRPPT